MYVADEPHPHKNECYDSRDGASVCSAKGCKYDEKRREEKSALKGTPEEHL